MNLYGEELNAPISKALKLSVSVYVDVCAFSPSQDNAKSPGDNLADIFVEVLGEIDFDDMMSSSQT